jgi:transposase
MARKLLRQQAMRPKIKLMDEPGRAAVKAALAAATDPALRRRLHAVRLAFRGQLTLTEIAATLDCARSSVAAYVRRFRQDGVAGLGLKPRGGARARRTKVAAATTAALLAGLHQGQWKRAKEIRHWLADQRGTRLSLAGVYSWLRRRGAKPKVPRKSHGKQDPAKTAAFKVQLAAALGALGLPPTAKVRLWVADEHRYGLIGVIRKGWSLRGVKPTAPWHAKYQWGCLSSALEVAGAGAAEALFTPSVNLDWSGAFLAQLAAADPESYHIVIWDGAGWHPTGPGPGVPERVRLVALPPYSPELNPVEKLGDLIKDRIANTLWQKLADIEAAIEEELRPLWQEPARVRQLIGEGWLLAEANASSPGLVRLR